MTDTKTDDEVIVVDDLPDTKKPAKKAPVKKAAKKEPKLPTLRDKLESITAKNFRELITTHIRQLQAAKDPTSTGPPWFKAMEFMCEVVLSRFYISYPGNIEITEELQRRHSLDMHESNEGLADELIWLSNKIDERSRMCGGVSRVKKWFISRLN